MSWLKSAFAALLVLLPLQVQAETRMPLSWPTEFPKTDFSNTIIDFGEIFAGGPAKDGIPAIDKPTFATSSTVKYLQPHEAVVSIEIDGDARAYPVRILMWHEIVNDQVGGMPVSVTYCPLCNAAIAFDRRFDNLVLDFGTTGKLRKSDLIMYDRQTETWWQQFSGEGLIGKYAGKELTMIPSRLEPFSQFKARHPQGKVLIPNNRYLRDYGRNPYVGYDTSQKPFLYFEDLPENINPMMRVVVVGEEAWSLPLLAQTGHLETDDLVIDWSAGMASALETTEVATGRDVGSITVQRKTAKGLEDTLHHVTFAFVFHAFVPDGELHR